MMRGSMPLSVGTCLAAACVLLGCGEASGQAVASCPVTVPSRQQLVKGSSLLGSAAAGTALFFSSVTRDTPEAIRAHGNGQSEIESDSEDVGGKRRARTWFDTADGPHTLVCQYGKALYPQRDTAMLLVPLPPRMSGECVVTSNLRPAKGANGRGMTATCSRARAN